MSACAGSRCTANPQVKLLQEQADGTAFRPPTCGRPRPTRHPYHVAVDGWDRGLCPWCIAHGWPRPAGWPAREPSMFSRRGRQYAAHDQRGRSPAAWSATWIRASGPATSQAARPWPPTHPASGLPCRSSAAKPATSAGWSAPRPTHPRGGPRDGSVGRRAAGGGLRPPGPAESRPAGRHRLRAGQPDPGWRPLSPVVWMAGWSSRRWSRWTGVCWW